MGDRILDQTNADERIPWLAWSSLWSIDAVLVAVTWQMLFSKCFLNRAPTPAEALSLGATVWLIYVADRLLDASRLDLNRPHTLRHRFYHRHASAFRVAWVAVLLVAVATVVRHLSFDLIQAGLILAAAVLVYGGGVHFLPKSGRDHSLQAPGLKWLFIPKEVQVGLLFAMGVSLVCWSESSTSVADEAVSLVPLCLATIVAAILFSLNCLLVSRWEAELDAAQLFTPRDGESKSAATYWLATLALLAIPMVAIMTPSTRAICGMSGWGILGMLAMIRWGGLDSTECRSLTRFELRSVLADWVLWMPPMMVGWL